MSIPDRATWGSAIEGRVLLCPVPAITSSRCRAEGAYSMPGMLLSCGEGARVIRGDANTHRGRVGRCSMAGSLPVTVDASGRGARWFALT